MPNGGVGQPGPGRPSAYSPELAQTICEYLEDGLTVLDVAAIDGMPSRATIFLWRETYPVFRTMYERARELSAETLEHEALRTIRNAETKEQAYAASTRFDVIKWVAAKRNPEVYGEKITQDVRFSGTVTVEHVTDRAQLLLELQRKLGIDAPAPVLIEGAVLPEANLAPDEPSEPSGEG